MTMAPKPPSPFSEELLDQLLAGYTKPEDLTGKDGILKQLTARLVERALQSEMTEHLGYEKHDPKGRGTPNSRNGTSPKTLKTELGEVDIEVPRDREGSFEPQLVKKRQGRFTGFDNKILGMYARGMTVRDIQGHLEDVYGVEVSPDLISKVTSAVVEDVAAWQNRPLDAVYPMVYLDALVVKGRDQGVVRNKSVYIALAVTLAGAKEVLGLWIEQNEGAKFWLKVVNELKTRGVRDVLIACCDGLKGFPEAIEAVFPQAVVQTCIVHMIRNSLRFVSYKDRKAVAKDLRPVYTATSREEALVALDAFEQEVGPPVPDDRRLLAQQLGARGALPRLPPGRAEGHLHHQRDRVPEQHPAQAPPVPGPLPHRRGGLQASLPGSFQDGEEVGAVHPRLEQRPRPVFDILQGPNSGVVSMTPAHLELPFTTRQTSGPRPCAR